MQKEVIIWFQFSLPVDLAGEMRSWPEFAGGEDYSVDLKNRISGETVAVRLIDDWESEHVSVKSENAGELFDRVVGRMVFA